jgi:hypothetical protein
MKELTFLTKKELIRELKMSRTTFYRRLKLLGIETTRGLLSSNEVETIKEALKTLKKP